ncbi:MAG TPA: type II toxin-antitoxin system PemK/MazF family toxin [Chthoniobacterales bacterium]|jgi:mRNA interferase MazF
MKRGTIVWINLEDAAPPEMGKTRPGVIVSHAEQNQLLPTVVVVPLSSRAPEIWPLRLRLEVAKLKTSFAITPGIRQVSRKRLLEPLAMAPADFMAELDRALAAYLDL